MSGEDQDKVREDAIAKFNYKDKKKAYFAWLLEELEREKFEEQGIEVLVYNGKTEKK